jgi:hypothetical protein
LGGGGFIFNILLKIITYIKNQYNEDKFYGLILIIIFAVFILIMCICFVKPIIDWCFINILHKREINKGDSEIKITRNQTNKIIDYYIASKKGKKNIDERISELIEELKNLKEE